MSSSVVALQTALCCILHKAHEFKIYSAKISVFQNYQSTYN